MPTTHTQHSPVHSPRYGPAIPPLRPQQSFPQPPPYDRLTSTDNYPCTDPSPRRRPRATAHEIHQFVLHQYRLHSRLPVTQRALHEVHSPHPLVQKEIPLHRHKASPTGHQDQILDSTSSRTLLESTLSKEFMCQSALITPLPHLNILSSQQQAPAIWGQFENECVQEGQARDLPLECVHFPLNPRFTQQFWHLSKYFFALADHPNDYWNTFFTRDTAPYKIYANYYPFYLQFGFLHPTQMDVNNTNHKVNRVKILHTMHTSMYSITSNTPIHLYT